MNEDLMPEESLDNFDIDKFCDEYYRQEELKDEDVTIPDLDWSNYD